MLNVTEPGIWLPSVPLVSRSWAWTRLLTLRSASLPALRANRSSLLDDVRSIRFGLEE